MSDERIPVTLLAGFLGSGKTTLLNRILTADHGRRVVVVVNEFGDAGIDASLVVGGEEHLVQLAGGCICCTVREDLRATLGDLLRRRGRGLFRPLRFDHVLIEASGLASPGPAVQTLLVDAELAAGYRPAGIVTLAHAAHIRRQLREHPEAAEQVAYADLVLLNHVDAADGAEIESARMALRECNGRAQIECCLRAEVDVATLLELEFSGQDPPPMPACDHGPHEPCEHVQHSSGVGTVTLRSDAALDGEALRVWLQFLSQRPGQELMRAKGCLRVAGSDRGQVLQGIYQWLDLEPGAGPAPARSVLVLIGRGLDGDELRRGWAAVER